MIRQEYIEYSYIVYFNLSECSCKYILKVILNLDIETLPLIRTA